MQLVKDLQVKIPREEVLRLLKHKKETTLVDERTSDLINKLIEEGKTLLEPKVLYKDYSVKSIGGQSVVLEACGFTLLGKSTEHRLWNAKKVTLFAATIGPALEKKIQELTKQGNIANAAILDAIGSVAVEAVVGFVNDEANRRAKEAGFKTVNRFSPGYGDWELKEQKGLLQQLNSSQIGISVTSAYLMQPEKSVSGAIGWVKNE